MRNIRKLALLLCLFAAALCLSACGCKHESTHLENKVDATCEDTGYSGDEICDSCGKTVKEGEAIPAAGHVPEVLYAREATCEQDGYTGQTICSVCGLHIDEGETIPAGHDWSEERVLLEPTCLAPGRTGKVCNRCGKETWNEVPERLPHSFEDNVCTQCGWRMPGEYEDGRLVHTWQELIDQGLISISSEIKVTRVSPDLTGLLVVEENFVLDLGSADGVNLTGIWTPCTMKHFEDRHLRTFKDLKELREVRLFACDGGLASKYGDGQFQGCVKLESVTLPDTCTYLGENCFQGCESMSSISLPESVYWLGDSAFAVCKSLAHIDMPGVTHIGGNAFAWCEALREIELPDALEEISDHAFEYSGLVRITLPRTLTCLGEWTFFQCASLEEVELHGAVHLSTVHAFGKEYTGDASSTFSQCTSLRKVIIGEDVTAIPREMFCGCSSLSEITFPEDSSVTTIGNLAFDGTAVTRLVLPPKLTELGSLDDRYDYRHYESIDMSRCAELKELTFHFDANELILPPNLEKISDCSLTADRIVLPDTLKEVNKVNMNCRQLVWPVSLEDGSTLSATKPKVNYWDDTEYALEDGVLYRGTEAQWNQIPHSDFWPQDVKVVFDYDGD